MPNIAAIVAVSENNAIGKDGTLPWHLPVDLAFFKEKTLEQTLLMGRKTYDSIGRPLPKRHSLILTRTPPEGSLEFENIGYIKNIEEALKEPLPMGDTLWVCGGYAIYELALPYCTDLYISHVHQNVEGADTFFPEYKERFEAFETVIDRDDFTTVHYKNREPIALGS